MFYAQYGNYDSKHSNRRGHGLVDYYNISSALAAQDELDQTLFRMSAEDKYWGRIDVDFTDRENSKLYTNRKWSNKDSSKQQTKMKAVAVKKAPKKDVSEVVAKPSTVVAPVTDSLSEPDVVPL